MAQTSSRPAGSTRRCSRDGKPIREHLLGARHRLEERAHQHAVQARLPLCRYPRRDRIRQRRRDRGPVRLMRLLILLFFAAALVAEDGMALIPAGEFTMGRTKLTAGRQDHHASARAARRPAGSQGNARRLLARQDGSHPRCIREVHRSRPAARSPIIGRSVPPRKYRSTTSIGTTQRHTANGRVSVCPPRPNGSAPRAAAWNR